MSYPTVTGRAVEGTPYREAQSCLGPAFSGATYQFFLAGSSTPANVYQDGALTTPFPITGFVSADMFGRFPPIYLDTSVIYRVQLFNSSNVQQWQADPYTPPLATVGTSSLSAFGFQIAQTGELTLDAPNAGGTGVTLTLRSGLLGSAALELVGTIPGNSAIIVNSSATTGAQTATFVATNKPGTATSAPAGWLPITCDGVQYYTPIWHGNPFSPYVSSPTAVGEIINANSVNFGGNGVTTVTNGSATPGNWFTPAATNVGAGYYINVSKNSGLSGVDFIVDANTIATVAPSGAAYVGGTLTANFTGNTGTNYTIVLTTGQVINGCTFTNGSTAFVTPSTSITGTPFPTLTVTIQGVWVNITGTGLTITTNAASTILGTYQLSTSPTGSPVVANGTIILGGNLGVQSPTYNGAANLVLAGNGTATLNGGGAPSWYTPTTASEGAGYYIYITPTGGTAGYSFSAANGVWANITNGGLTIGISGPVGPSVVTGTYIIASDPAGVNRLGTGSITLTGGTDVQSPNWSGTTPLNLAGNGSATLNGVSTSSWYSPNTSNVGSGYYINVTRTSGTAGVNFSAAQGSWTNITNGGLSIGMSGYTGDVGTVTIGGTYQISSSSSGTPVLGSGTISLSVNAGTVIHVYTTPTTNSTETIPTGTTTVRCEVWGSGGGGGGFDSNVNLGGPGGSGCCGGFAYSSYAASALGGSGRTLKYTITAGGAGGAAGSPSSAGSPGSAGSITAGTVTGFTTMTGNGGGAGANGRGTGGGAGGAASGGNTNNITGATASTTGTTGKITGDGGPYGGGGGGGFSGNGSSGQTGAVVFYYS